MRPPSSLLLYIRPVDSLCHFYQENEENEKSATFYNVARSCYRKLANDNRQTTLYVIFIHADYIMNNAAAAAIVAVGWQSTSTRTTKTAHISTNPINLFKCSQLFRAGKYQEQ